MKVPLIFFPKKSITILIIEEILMTIKYGYARVSSADQNERRQVVALEEMGIPTENIYMDKLSGKDFNRPQYLTLVDRLQEGDLLCIVSIDRLGRNYEDIQQQWRLITKEKKVDINVLHMPLLNTDQHKDLLGTFIADLVLQILSYVAQTERENIRRRQAEGIAAAKDKGVRFGHEPKPLPPDFPEIYELWKNGSITTSEAARRTNMARSTFRIKAKAFGEKQG